MRLFASRKARRTAPAHRASAFRPRLEALEDRCLLSAGALDPTFNPTGNPPGTAIAAPSSLNNHATAVLIQPSGKIVVTGGSNGAFSAACFNPNGSLDATFGSGGTVIPSFRGNVSTGNSYAAALYPTGSPGDQKILEVGYGSSSHGTRSGFALVRYNANGSLDTSFGNGGLVVTIFPQGSTGAAGVVIRSDSKIVVAGDNGSGFELARYNANGSLDTTFGSGGTVYTPHGTYTYQQALAQDANGNLVVVGETGYPGSQMHWLLARYQPNGTLDPSFGNGGLVTTSLFLEATAVAIQGDGKIVVAGWDNQASGFDLARFNPDGSLDPTWGGTGTVTTSVSAFSEAWAVAIQSDGKVVAAGQSEPDTTGHWQFALTRYNADGSLDGTFGIGGIVTTSFGVQSYIRGMILQSNGDIVVAGSTTTTINNNYKNPNFSITQVAFYRDSNGDGVLQPGTDALVGYAIQTSPGVWTLTFTVSLPPGSSMLFARAQDSYGVFGDPFALNFQVL